MHGADRDLACFRLYLVAQLDTRRASDLDRGPRAFQLLAGSNEQADLMRLATLFQAIGEPVPDGFALFRGRIEGADLGRRPVEHGDGATAALGIAVDVGDVRRQQPIRLGADLVGGAIVDPQCVGASANVDAERFPREGLLEDALPLQERIETVADESDLEEVYNTERHLLYVACTRARDRLLITGVDPASEFLDDLAR